MCLFMKGFKWYIYTMAYLTNRIQVCLSDQEYSQLKEEAKNSYRTVSTYCRELTNRQLNGTNEDKNQKEK